MALKPVGKFQIRGIGPVVTERLNEKGIYTLPDADRYVGENGLCGLMEVMKVGPMRSKKVLRHLRHGGGLCPRCMVSMNPRRLETAYDSVVRRRECPLLAEGHPHEPEQAFMPPESPPLPWVGGKRKMVDDILPLIPAHKRYVELMTGGGAVFFAKQPAEENVLNDKDAKLMDVYDELRKDGDIEVDIKPTKTNFYKYKAKGEAGKTDTKEWLFMLKTGFGHKSPSWRPDGGGFPGRYLVKHFADPLVRSKEHLQIPRLKIKSKDYRDVVEEYHADPDTFFFADPPYHETSNPYAEADLTPYNLRETLEGVKGKVMVTYNDHPDVREAFSGWNIKQVETAHTLQGGQRKAKELIITNYPTGS